ncbi:MAG: hypothetical protein J2P15_04620 [Micromonosporaceae bacterium]|nr:hypothetical protein [Micromonosporaceae bacterium]
MALASFKDLCLDSGDVPRLAGFWRQVLGGQLYLRNNGVGRLEPLAGRPASEVVWINPVPEPRIGKTRVHLDLRLAAPDPAGLLSAGTAVVRAPAGHARHWVLADPEGNQFCAFPPDEPVAGDPNQSHRPGEPGVFQLVTDCRDSEAQAAWWAQLLGGSAVAKEYGAVLVGAEGFPWEGWLFQPVPEPKTVKNRVHWDLSLAAPVPDELLGVGASVLREPGGDIDWWVLADPEGNEFCAFPAER